MMQKTISDLHDKFGFSTREPELHNHAISLQKSKNYTQGYSYRHFCSIDNEDVSIAGYSPSLFSRDDRKVRLIPLARPKIMASPHRATKTCVASKFYFNLYHIKHDILQVGTEKWDTRDFFAANPDGSLRNQGELVKRMCDFGQPKYGPRDFAKPGSNYVDREQYHDLVLYGCMNDGASVALHVKDFVPWKVYEFDKSVGAEEISSAMEQIKHLDNGRLSSMTYNICQKKASDGTTPCKTNPYLAAKSMFVYVYNTDASTSSYYHLSRAMEMFGAVEVEDYAMSPELRFKQLTEICETQWYCIEKWRESSSFSTTVQVELDVSWKDIRACPDNDETCVLLAPHLVFSVDIETHKDSIAQPDNGLPDPDLKQNSVITIAGNLIRFGACSKFEQDSPFVRKMPRMEDIPIVGPNNDPIEEWNSIVPLPDPLMVHKSEQSKSKSSKTSPRPAERRDEPELHFGHIIHGDDTGAAESSDNEDDGEEEVIVYRPLPGVSEEQLNDVMLSSGESPKHPIFVSKHDQEDDTSNNPFLKDPMSSAILSGRLLSVGNYGDADFDIEHNFTTSAQEARRRLVLQEDPDFAKELNEAEHEMLSEEEKNDKLWKPSDQHVHEMVETKNSVHSESSSASSSKDASTVDGENFLSIREMISSQLSRNGFEVPQWAVDTLDARKNVSASNETAHNPVLTPMVLDNLRNVRNIAWQVVPTMQKEYDVKIIPGLYEDDSGGILCHMFKNEANALLSFRDFYISYHPDCNQGHFYRNYDWRTLFCKANLLFNDRIPTFNRSRDDPLDDVSKMHHSMPIVEGKYASTKSDNLWLKLPDQMPHCQNLDRFQLVDFIANYSSQNQNYGQNSGYNKSNKEMDPLQRRASDAKQWSDPYSRKSCFAFMDRRIFTPVHVDRKIVSSNNTGSTESYAPSLNGMDDIDTLIAIRLSADRLPSYSLLFLSKKFLNDAKMDIGIARMDKCYDQKQYWPIVAYCVYDALLSAALMATMDLRTGHAASSRNSFLPMGDMVNFGQQRGIYAKNAVALHKAGSVLVKSSVRCPSLFNGGFVSLPRGGIYPCPLSCLDFASYYVTIIMEHGLCFTTYVRPWDDNFNPIDMSRMTPVEIAKNYREFVARARKVYGIPANIKRPGAMFYNQCKRCHVLKYSSLPDSFFALDDGTNMRHVLKEIYGPSSTPELRNQHKSHMMTLQTRISQLPRHCDIEEGRWPSNYFIHAPIVAPSIINSASSQAESECHSEHMVRHPSVPSWMSVEEFSKIKCQSSSECSNCISRPWFNKMDPVVDHSKVPDVTCKDDPFREQRYAADANYLFPRSCATMFQSDPEAHYMQGRKRINPKNPNQCAREDLLTEGPEFDWISPQQWAENRVSCTIKHYDAEWQKKQGKKKSEREVAEKKRAANANSKYDTKPAFVPSMASFVLWRPGDFNNQAASDLLMRYHSGDVDLTEEELSILEKRNDVEYDPLIDKMRTWRRDKLKGGNFNVQSFSKFAEECSNNCKSEMWRHMADGLDFDRSKYDVQYRRGIDQFGSNTDNVKQLFFGRKRIRKRQGAIMSNPSFYNPVTKKWLDPVQKQNWLSCEKAQLKTKEKANSYFGASGTRTGAIRNMFVAAAITFISRNYIRYTTYVNKVRWTPSEKIYADILKFRREAILNNHGFKGINREYYERYILGAAFPLSETASRQRWHKPISAAVDFMDPSHESSYSAETIYGDTDSIMPMAPGVVVGNPLLPNNEVDIERRQLGIDLGESGADLVTKHFRMYGFKYMTIEWEKMFCPFAVPDLVKKKYIGRYYSKAKEHDKDMVRSWLIKRDIPAVYQDVRVPIINQIMTTMDRSAVEKILTDSYSDMIASRGSIADDKQVARFSKSQAFKKTNYTQPAPHFEANQRLQRDFPGHEYALGERVDYVVCTGQRESEKICERSYTLRHLTLLKEATDDASIAKRKKLKIDIAHYVKKSHSVVRDVLRITQPQNPIHTDPSKFASASGSLALYLMSSPRHMWDHIPPNAPENLLLYSARLWKNDEDGTISVMSNEDFLAKRLWYEDEMEKFMRERWGYDPRKAEEYKRALLPSNMDDMDRIGRIKTSVDSDKNVEKYFDERATLFIARHEQDALRTLRSTPTVQSMFAKMSSSSSTSSSGNRISHSESELSRKRSHSEISSCEQSDPSPSPMPCPPLAKKQCHEIIPQEDRIATAIKRNSLSISSWLSRPLHNKRPSSHDIDDKMPPSKRPSLNGKHS